jgi:formate-dependent nitrite reductase membrane component NrfD
MLLADAQHFVRPPEWTWYILFYFFLAGLSGGSYVIATLLRLRGDPADEPAARLGYYIALPPMLISPLLLALDLGKPWRFWHMLWNTTPDESGVNFKYWSPMSVGAWALVIFGAITTVSFVEALVRDRKIRLRFAERAVRLLDGARGKIFNIVGSLFGLFVAGYTGVLLSVSNQPVWSDTWALGGLFLASGLTSSAALMILLTRFRSDAQASLPGLDAAERLYAVLELLLIVVFALTLIPEGTLDQVFGFPWALLWLVALAGLVPPLGGLFSPRLAFAGGTGAGGTVAVPITQPAVAASSLVLIGTFALRAAVIFSIQ